MRDKTNEGVSAEELEVNTPLHQVLNLLDPCVAIIINNNLDFIDLTLEKLPSAFNPFLREQWAANVRHLGSILALRVLLRNPEWQAVGFEPGFLWPLQDTNALL
ncbi:hypothetical protein ILYODFUR_006171 [Ilyodon furcidens]|uniref:Uncharacterized protein n=1 Tax=Ilyodon furcidens TaxID=33524 RepID=A0ABV0V0P1_9TELE